MTCREKLQIEHPDRVGCNFMGGCCGCPNDYGYLDEPEYCQSIMDTCEERCSKCWDREIPGTEDHTPLANPDTKKKQMEKKKWI